MALPIGMLPDAEAKAAAMFREVGGDLRILKREPHSSDGACGMPVVIEFENAHNYTGTARAMAYARPYQNVGTSVHVFIDRVLSGRDPHIANTVLAHILVHEITHVLERVARHSDSGIMKAVLSPADYQQMKLHPLPLSPEDIDLIHEAIGECIPAVEAARLR
jgi:hypothetical protein